MSGLFDTVFQTFKDKLPNISWKFGSVVRTLIVDPLVKLDEAIDSYSSKLEQSYDLQAILDDPAANEEFIDMWLDLLGIVIPSNTASTGTVVLTLNSQEEMTITENVVFSWGDTTLLRVSETTTWGGDSGNPMQFVSPGLYKIEIPVTTDSDFPCNLAHGTPLNWDAAPNTVQEIYVGSPVTGGVTQTAAAKALLLKTALDEPSTCGKSAMLTGLVRNFGPVFSDVLNGPRVVSFGNSGLSVYVKQTELPRIVTIEQIPEKDGNTYTTNINTCGVIKILSVASTGGTELPIETIEQSGDIGDYGSNATITITTENDITGPIKIKVLKYELEADCAEWLNAYQTGSPAKIIVKTPAFAEISMHLHLDGSELNLATAQTIADYVSRSALNATITDSNIDSILNAAGLTRISPTLFSAKILFDSYSNTVTSSGAINLSSVLGKADIPVAMYCSVNDIKAV